MKMTSKISAEGDSAAVRVGRAAAVAEGAVDLEEVAAAAGRPLTGSLTTTKEWISSSIKKTI